MRPIRTRICHINVAKWFPANDPIATSVAGPRNGDILLFRKRILGDPRSAFGVISSLSFNPSCLTFHVLSVGGDGEAEP